MHSGFAVWLCSGKADWARGRYLSANWDVDELAALKDQIVNDDQQNTGKFKIEINEVKELVHIMIAVTKFGLGNDDMVQQQGLYYYPHQQLSGTLLAIDKWTELYRRF